MYFFPTKYVPNVHDLLLRCDGCETVSCMVFFHTKTLPEPRWSISAVQRLQEGLVSGRITLGSFSDRFRIVNGVPPVFRVFLRSTEFHCNLKIEDRSCNGNGVASGVGGQVADGIALLFATLGSFPYCKWDCKWCCCRSCRWSFQGSPARNAFLRDNSCMKPCLKLTSWLLRLFGYWTGSRMFAFGRCSTEKCFVRKR